MPRPMGRAKGQGTVVPIAPTATGRKRRRVAVTMPDGKRVYRTASGRTDAEADRAGERIRAQLVEARESDLDPSRLTLAAFLRSWIAALEGARNARVRPRTLEHYRMIVERHILASSSPIASLRLSQVTVGRVQAWLDADPMSPRTVHHHRAVLRRALNVAVRQRLLVYNPAALVEVPDVEADHSEPLTPDEARRLIAVTADDRLGLLWRLALASGLRLGELLGLGWDDVDVEGRYVTVRGQLQRLAPDRGGDVNGWARTPPKAARRIDRVAIDDETAAALARHRSRQAAERTPEWRYFGLVFVTERGDPYHPSVALMAFRRACDLAGIRRRRIHDLRHTHNRLLKDAGVTEEAREARMGWSSESRMSRHYGGASEALDRAAATAIARVIAG